MTVEELKKTLPISPVFKIEFTKETVDYTKSKLGGYYYWTDEKGPEGFQFLAQINFAELPENDIFPKIGLLQFFCKDDDSYGLSEEDGNSHLVVYHKDITKGYKVRKDFEYSPIEKEDLGMKFELTEEYLSNYDYRFDTSIELTDEIYEAFDGSGCKLLGYPAFTQFDPREEGSPYDTLLFQLDTVDDIMMWGDCGVANFFISSKNLKKLDFSDVLYNWDCC